MLSVTDSTSKNSGSGFGSLDRAQHIQNIDFRGHRGLTSGSRV